MLHLSAFNDQTFNQLEDMSCHTSTRCDAYNVRISVSEIANCEEILEIAKTCEAIILRIAKVITLRCKTLRYVVRRYTTL